jgi:hypothetical protein
MEPKVNVTVEGLPELLRHTAQDLQTIIDKRTELVMLLDDLWLLLDQIKARLPDNTLVYDLRVDLGTDGTHLDNMILEDAENILDELRHIHGWGMGE